MKNLNEQETQFLMIEPTKIRLVRVSTTSNDEEDFLLLTDLNDQEIADIVTPIVEKERNEEQFEEYFYDNEGLFWALKDNYPNNVIIQYTDESIETLTI